MKKRTISIHTFLIGLSGCITWPMSELFEMEGGGTSLIIVLTIPFFLVLGLIFMILLKYSNKIIKKKSNRFSLIILFYVILIIGSIILFPFKNSIIYAY